MHNSSIVSGRSTPIRFEDEPWVKKPWRKFEKIVFRLQKRIYAARKQGNLAKANRLQRKLLKSRAAMFLAVRKVTQLNAGKRTAGVDGKTAPTERERKQLVTRLEKEAGDWKPSPARRVLIPKPDGTQRKLGIPTIADRAWQALVTLALEPSAEATFHANSYGFRPGRGCWDAHKITWIWTNRSRTGKNFAGYVYELDIEKCFDKIDHLDLINRVELPKKYRHGLFRTLKTGVVGGFSKYEDTTQGTPQGGVISPLLANISLNGIETLGRCVRYADDMVFIIRKGENALSLAAKVRDFLAIRGLKAKASKTKLVSMKGRKGFDFLGLNFFHKPNGTSASRPRKDWLEKTKRQVRNLIKSALPKKELAQKIHRIMDGKRRFYRYSDLGKVQGEWWKLSQLIYRKLGKGLPALTYKVNRHINVKGDKSPYDGDWRYWVQRNNRRYEGNNRAKIFKRQNGKCGMCGLYMTENMEIHLHHMDGNHANNKLNNRQLVHRACHMLHHGQRARGKQCHL